MTTRNPAPTAKLRFQKQLPKAQAATPSTDLINTRYKVFITVPDLGTVDHYLGYIVERPGRTKTTYLAYLLHESGKQRYVGDSWAAAIDTLSYHISNNILGLLVTKSYGEHNKYRIIELTNPLELQEFDT